jgi:hypothetical protein
MLRFWLRMATFPLSERQKVADFLDLREETSLKGRNF